MCDSLPFLYLEGQNHFCVGVDHNIGVVCDRNYLPFGLDLFQLLDYEIIDKFIVQVVFWLVKEKGVFTIRQNERE